MRKEQRVMSDKELDDFFRKRSGNPDIPYDPADWRKMKAKLDHHSATGSINGSGLWYKGWFIPFVALMVVIGIGLEWKYMEKGSGKNGENLSSSPSTMKFDPEETEKKKLATMDSADNDEVTKSPSKPEAKGPEKSRGVAMASGKDFDRTSTSTGMERGVGAKDMEKESGNHRSSTSEKAGYLMEDIVHSTIKEHKDRILKNEGSVDAMSPGFFKARVYEGYLIIPAPVDQQASTSKKEKERKGKDQFSIAMVLAPDVSALKIKDISGLGTSIGLNMEYFIHPNMSLNVGALYAFKTYQGGEVDYKGYASSPNGIRGDCWVLDIPLNGRYYVINRDLDRWYVSGGMSSYFMLREKYELDYKNYKGNIYTKEVEVENNNRHYLGIVNLGLGYQRVLSDHLAIQIEPYLKLPIKGIGEGEINLKSAGVLVGMKYNW